MFDVFKSGGKKIHGAELTSLGLRTESMPDAEQGVAAGAKTGQGVQGHPAPTEMQNCLQISINPETMLALGKDLRRRSDAWMEGGQKPEVMFYLVFPQQGHTLTVSSKDGTKTIVPVFGSTWIARGYLRGRRLNAVIAACRVDAVAEQAEKWMLAGINSYGLNPCFRCGSLTPYPIAGLDSREEFVESWGLDLITRRIFAEIVIRNCQSQMAKNPQYVRELLERVRDHLDCGVPYLHWMIAILAGVGGDVDANAAGIARLEEFGPSFVGKLKGSSFHPTEPESQLRTMPEAMLGLLAAYGLVNLPMKPAES